MNDLAVVDIKPITSKQEEKLQKGLIAIGELDEQVILPIEHFIHAGCYVRTMKGIKGAVMGSALIKIPTVVIVSGKCELTNGDERMVINGFKVLRADCPRRAVWFFHEDTYITMVFATKKKTVGKCEKEFTDEWKLLQNNREV